MTYGDDITAPGEDDELETDDEYYSEDDDEEYSYEEEDEDDEDEYEYEEADDDEADDDEDLGELWESNGAREL